MQTEVLTFKARLQALASRWPDSTGPVRLAPSSSEILSVLPDFDGIRLSVSNTAPKVWTELLSRLIAGDADAVRDDVTPLVPEVIRPH